MLRNTSMCNVNMTIKNPPPPPPPPKKNNLFCDFGLRKGRAPITSQGVGVGLGSAARSTSSTSRRKSGKLEIFCGGQYYCCHPLTVADGTCLIYFRAPNLFGSKHHLPDFSGLATIYCCHLHYGMQTFNAAKTPKEAALAAALQLYSQALWKIARGTLE